MQTKIGIFYLHTDLFLVFACSSSQSHFSSFKFQELTRVIPNHEFESNRRFVETPFGRIAYAELGKGQPAISLLGLGLNSYIWAGQLSGLFDTRRCIAPDLMAHGHTEIDQNQEVSFTDQTDMLIASRR